ncbi:hypothetical protein, partial [Chamaesiphon sp. VAR_48_metabat_403]|uniref:hypothetical protein n=1 Tax=Chamaesiphon sp. VAR_48_metabat_403 TaxID=2964700 RepID=UPI00286E74F2
MKVATLTNLVKTQLPTQVLLSILAVSLCLGTSDRASAITDSAAPAATCANVEAKIQNGTTGAVKVTKFE